MHRIQDKKRWWAANFCTQTSPIQQNRSFDILAPIGLMVVMVGILSLAALAYYHPHVATGVSLANAPTFVAIKEAIDNQATAFDAYKKTNDERLDAVRTGNETKAKELDVKLSKIETDVQKFGELKKTIEIEQQLHRERIEELESRSKAPGRTQIEQKQGEYRDAFVTWMRNKGASPNDEQKLINLGKQLVEMKDITVGSSAGGGYALPKEIASEIAKFELLFSPVRRLVKVIQVGTTDFHQLLNLRGATSGWVGETGSRTATNTPTLRDIIPTMGEIYAYPQVSEWSLDDLGFNVENWLAENVGDEFAYQEGVAVISGNGTNKPTGMTNTAPGSATDVAGTRTAAQYQYVSSTQSPSAVSADSIIDVSYALNSALRGGSVYVMNSNTQGAVRKLKDTTNQYLWQPSLQAGQPDTLNGYRVETWEQLDDIGVHTFPLAFGNFQRGYMLVDRVGLRITRDNITNPGYVRFYVRRREGGIVFDNNAIKFVRCT